MRWTDEALVIGGRPFGEANLILDVLTRERGRRSGMAYGAKSSKRRARFDPGNRLRLSWTARLEDQLGRFEHIEMVAQPAAAIMDRPGPLTALLSATAILRAALRDGDAAGSDLFEATADLLDALESGSDGVWPAVYVKWEMGLLSALGYGLDLSECAVSGDNQGLTHVSPRTGRAVTAAAAEGLEPRLLALPPFLRDASAPLGPSDISAGLRLTRHFLERNVLAPAHAPLPIERVRLGDRLARRHSQME